MIIVLGKANFSKISIGNADIPVDISQWTNDVIAKYPNYNWDYSAKQALERFHLSLVKNQILENIEYLALPIFASNIEEATQDALGGSMEITIPEDASVRYNVVTGKGIARNGNVNSERDAISVGFTRGDNFPLDCHFMAYPTENVVESNNYKATTKISENPDVTGWFLASYMQTWGFGYGIHSFIVGCVLDVSGTVIRTRFWGSENKEFIDADVNFAKLSEPAIASSYNKVISLSQAEQNYISKNVTKGLYFNGFTNQSEQRKIFMGLSPVIADGVWSARHFGFLGYGKHLTNEQSISYQKALKKLVADLNG